jgi:hypothetical protein
MDFKFGGGIWGFSFDNVFYVVTFSGFWEFAEVMSV